MKVYEIEYRVISYNSALVKAKTAKEAKELFFKQANDCIWSLEDVSGTATVQSVKVAEDAYQADYEEAPEGIIREQGWYC